MTKFGAWLRRGSGAARTAKVWVSVFASTMVIVLVWLALTETPSVGDPVILYMPLVFGIVAALIVGESLRPISTPLKAVAVVFVTAALFVISALPATFAAGMIVGAVERAFG